MMEYTRQLQPGDKLSMTFSKAKAEKQDWLSRNSPDMQPPAAPYIAPSPISPAGAPDDRAMLEQMMASRSGF